MVAEIALFVSIFSFMVAFGGFLFQVSARPRPVGWKRLAKIYTEHGVWEELGYQVHVANDGRSALLIESVGWYSEVSRGVNSLGGKFLFDPSKPLITNPETPCALLPGQTATWYFPNVMEENKLLVVSYMKRPWKSVLVGKGSLKNHFYIVGPAIKAGPAK